MGMGKLSFFLQPAEFFQQQKGGLFSPVGFGPLRLGFLLLVAALLTGNCTPPEVDEGVNSVAARHSVLSAEDIDCPYGGILVETGIDLDGSGILDTAEVTNTEKVCNGDPGATTLMNVTTVSPGGTICPSGGLKIEVGVDDNGDGVLDATEVDQTDYVCGSSYPAGPYPTATIDTPITDLSVAAGDSVNFTATVTGTDTPFTYDWNFDANSVGGGPAASTVEDPGAVTFTTAGTYLVRFTVTDSNGDTATDNVTVTVGVAPALAVFINSPTTGPTIAPGGSVSFATTVSGGTAPYSYAWNFDVNSVGGGPAASTVEDPGAVTFTTAGTYLVRFTVTDSNGGTATDELTVTVSPSLAAGLPLFDNFNSGVLDSTKWVGTTQAYNEIIAGELVVRVETPADAVANWYGSDLGLLIPAVTGFAADLKIADYVGNLNFPSTGFNHVWFYTDSSGNPVGASMQMRVGEWGYSVVTCSGAPDTEACWNSQTEIANVWTPLTIGVSEVHRMTATWDGATTISFQFDTGTPVAVSGLPAFGSVITSSEVEFGVGFSSNGGAARFAQGIDNINIDTGIGLTLYEDFSAGTLDPAMWVRMGTLRVEAGAVHATQTNGGLGLDLLAGLGFGALSVDANLLSQTGDGKAGLFTGLYLTGLDAVFGFLELNATQTVARVYHCPNPCDIFAATQIATQVLGSVTLGSTHTLFMQWDGNAVTFQLDGAAPYIVDAATLGYTVTSSLDLEFTLLSGNLKDNAGTFASGSGSSDLTYDNVRAGPAVTVP